MILYILIYLALGVVTTPFTLKEMMRDEHDPELKRDAEELKKHIEANPSLMTSIIVVFWPVGVFGTIMCVIERNRS